MSVNENPYAGQGPVLLDIGDDVGALIVLMPDASIGLEVEIRPLDQDGRIRPTVAGQHFPHVAVVPRQLGTRTIPSLVYPEVEQGFYRLCPLPHEQPTFDVAVAAGTVTEASWDLPEGTAPAPHPHPHGHHHEHPHPHEHH